MFVGIDCFRDSEIRAIIEDDGKIGHCSVTGADDVIGYDTNDNSREYDLGDELSEIVNIYTPVSELPTDYPDDKLEYLSDVLVEGWAVFDIAKEKIVDVVREICKNNILTSSSVYYEKVGIEELADDEYLNNRRLTKNQHGMILLNLLNAKIGFIQIT